MELSTPSLESIWLELRPHLEWANGFNLVFLFADHPGPVGLLRQRYDDSLHLRTLRLRVLAPASLGQLAGLTDEMLTPRSGFGPLWVELWRQGDDPAWGQARALLLHQLNERRSVLERAVRQPVVLVLPLAERGGVYVSAPDLWAVRSFTARLTGLIASHPSVIITPEAKPKPSLLSGPSAAELEWARLLHQTKGPADLNLWDGFAAFDSAMERGTLDDARHIATETLNMARERLKPKTKAQFWTGWLQKPPSPDSEHLRDLSVSLNNVGKVEADLGNLEPARAAYRESLVLRRQLRQAFPDHAQLVRDLAWIEARWAEFIERHGEA